MNNLLAWSIYPLDEPEDIDTFDSQDEAMNTADRLANASNRNYRVTNGMRSFTIEPDEED